MLRWLGIILDVVDTSYRGGVLCLRGAAFCSTFVYGVSTTSSIIPHHVSIMPHLCMAYPPQ